MHATQYPVLFVTYRDSFALTTVNENPRVVADETPITQNSMSSPSVFEFVYNKCYILPLNRSKRFGTVGYDAHINTKIFYSITHVFNSKTIQVKNTLHHMCELEKTPLLTVLAMTVKNPQFSC